MNHATIAENCTECSFRSFKNKSKIYIGVYELYNKNYNMCYTCLDLIPRYIYTERSYLINNYLK